MIRPRHRMTSTFLANLLQMMSCEGLARCLKKRLSMLIARRHWRKMGSKQVFWNRNWRITWRRSLEQVDRLSLGSCCCRREYGPWFFLWMLEGGWDCGRFRRSIRQLASKHTHRTTLPPSTFPLKATTMDSPTSMTFDAHRQLSCFVSLNDDDEMAQLILEVRFAFLHALPLAFAFMRRLLQYSDVLWEEPMQRQVGNRMDLTHSFVSLFLLSFFPGAFVPTPLIHECGCYVGELTLEQDVGIRTELNLGGRARRERRPVSLIASAQSESVFFSFYTECIDRMVYQLSATVPYQSTQL